MTQTAGEICDALGLKALVLAPRYNIAPTQPAPVILNQGNPEMRLLRWGLIPFWAKELSQSPPLINARAETILEKPAFRRALERQRCLVLADGYYEWQRTETGKMPLRYIIGRGEPFAFAGLWDEWRSADGAAVQSFTIITTAANELCQEVHGRMPAILRKPDYEAWLNPQQTDDASFRRLLASYPASEMRCYPVSARVNNTRNDDAECIEPLRV